MSALKKAKGEISHIYNTFDTDVKHKFEIRDKVENQAVLNKTISYLNKTAFTINNEVLDFIVNGIILIAHF